MYTMEINYSIQKHLNLSGKVVTFSSGWAHFLGLNYGSMLPT